MEETIIKIKTGSSKFIELRCEIAKTIFQKMKGLMNREKLEKDTGLLFTFTFPWIRIFWMKNVKIPLDIIFINSKQEIIKIVNAPIETGPFYKKYTSGGLCKYVIETNMGFCKENNIKKGNKVEIKNL
jgi:hypothetical protein